MSEVLRDLVVSLSLDGDNFSRNLTSINKQIQEAESEFKRAAAGVDGFEKSVAAVIFGREGFAVENIKAGGVRRFAASAEVEKEFSCGFYKYETQFIVNFIDSGRVESDFLLLALSIDG